MVLSFKYFCDFLETKWYAKKATFDVQLSSQHNAAAVFFVEVDVVTGITISIFIKAGHPTPNQVIFARRVFEPKFLKDHVRMYVLDCLING